MSRPVLVLLAVAAVFTGGMAFMVLKDSSGGRGRREQAPVRRETVERDRPAEATPEPEAERRREERVFGQVADTSGRGVAGATIQLADKTVRSAADGTYEVGISGYRALFTVFANGYLPVVARDFIGEGRGPWKLDFELTPAARLHGRILAPNGAPLGNANVYLVRPDRGLVEGAAGLVATVVFGNGYNFAGVPAGTYDLGVRVQGYLPELVRDVVIPEAGTVEKDVTMRAGRTVRVTVRNATAATHVLVSDARLRERLLPPGGRDVLMNALVGREYVDFPVAGVYLGDDHSFDWSGLPAGPVDFRITDPHRMRVDLRDVTDDKVTVTLTEAAGIDVRVTDEATREGLEPTLFLDDAEAPLAWSGGATTVPVDGRPHVLHLRLDGYEEGRIEIPAAKAAWPGVFEATMRKLTDDKTGRFTLEFDGEFEGRVAVVGRDTDGRWAWQKHLDFGKEPRRAVTGIPFGEYRVSVLATGKIPVVLPRVVVARNLDDHHRVTLTTGGGLEMRVTDRNDKLLEKVGILLRDPDGNQIDIHIMTYLSDRRAFVSVNSLPVAATARADSGLAPGVYTLTAWCAGYEPATQEFVVRGEEVAKVAISLTSRG
ncbi:MAG: carboxypeptidase regulatory-like domain-containing protein [Planctomycetota bacterium]